MSKSENPISKPPDNYEQLLLEKGFLKDITREYRLLVLDPKGWDTFSSAKHAMDALVEQGRSTREAFMIVSEQYPTFVGDTQEIIKTNKAGFDVVITNMAVSAAIIFPPGQPPREFKSTSN